MTRIEDNKAIARRFLDAIHRRDIDAAAAMVAENLRNHAAIPKAQGAAGLRVILQKLFDAFPDQTLACEDVIAEGDRVVCRVIVRGTHAAPLRFAKDPLPATGKAFETQHIHVLRIEDGKVAEHWAGRDDVGMLRQLGLLPTEARA